jgi:uncharacterized protein YfaS (alpha-2-macroglobulin family)
MGGSELSRFRGQAAVIILVLASLLGQGTAAGRAASPGFLGNRQSTDHSLTMSTAPTAVLGWMPGIGADVSPASPVTVYFNRAMDRQSVERAWNFTPAVRGSFRWSGTALTFRPVGLLQSGREYRLTVGSTARSVQGIRLARSFAASFSVGDRLKILSYSPLKGTVGVPQNGLISVTFNHPMVPLAGLSDTPRSPAGWRVAIAPAVSGRGSWLGTSTWVFHPDHGLSPSTTYTVTVGGRARDASGETLGRDLRWSFRAVTPQVFSRSPGNGARFVDPRTAITVTFNQPMDHRSTAHAFAVHAGRTRVAGTITWKAAELIFQPTRALGSATPYVVTVAASARSANRAATLGKRVRWQLDAAPPPRTAGTSPRQAGTAYNYLCQFCRFRGPYPGPIAQSGYSATIRFNTPMSKASLDRSLSVSPKIAHLQTTFYGPDNSDSFEYTVYGDFAPSRSYTFRLANRVTDAFGRPLGHSFIYRFNTAELHPSVALYGMPGQGSISASAGRVVSAPVQFMNVPKLEYTLIKTDAATVLSGCCYQGPPSGPTVRGWTVTLHGTRNKVDNVTAELTQRNGAPLAPGLYYLSATAAGSMPGLPPNEPIPSTWEIVLVRNVGVTLKTGGNGTLAWVTSEQTGEPLPGVKVQLVGGQGATLATGTTDSRGLHFFKVASPNGTPSAVVSDGTHYGLAESGWFPSASLPNDTPFFWYPGWYGPTVGGSYLYTDRPVYRPGQIVHFRGVLWRDQDGVYSSLGSRPVTVQAIGPYGRQVYHARIRLDRFGAIHGSFRVPAGAHTGDGNLWIGISNGPSTGTTFTVADYRKPEFLTSMTTAAPSYVTGQTLTASVRVRYVFGAPATREKVHWIAYAQPQFTQPPRWDEYTFFDWERYWQQFDGVNPSNSQQSQFGNQIGSGTAATGANGRMTIRLPVKRPAGGTDETITVEATATDVNHQSVSGRIRVPGYVSGLAIGLLPESRVVPAGRSVTVDIAAVHHDGTPYVGARLLQAVIARRTYSNKLVQGPNRQSTWQAVPHDTAIERLPVTVSAGGKGTISFSPPVGGEYVVTVSGRDAAGNEARTAVSIDASAAGLTDWGLSSDTSIALKADKTVYSVGDTAHLLVAAPFADSAALVTVERGNIRRYWVRHFTSSSPTPASRIQAIDIPITPDDLPNVYVTVTLYRGTREGSPPDWRYGIQELHVRLDPKHVMVHVVAGHKRYHPGDRVTYRITTTDAQGRPVSVQLSLALVDTAVLALKDELNPDILQALYADRPLDVSTAADGAVSVDHLQTAPEYQILPAGGVQYGVNGTAQGSAADLHAAPVLAVPKPGGGGGGYAAQPSVTVRSNFADTAYWAGSVMTNAAGHATVSFRLPDNATTWRLDARGVTAQQQVGQARVSTPATQDLILRPVLPRFFVQGDRLHIGVILNDNISRAVKCRVSVVTEGIHVDSAVGDTVTVSPHGEQLVQWTATVPESSAARLLFQAVAQTAGVRGDAVEMSVPVHPPLTDETVATAGQVFGAMRQAVIVPRRAVAWPGALTVQVSASLTAGLGVAFSQLLPQPYDSNDDVAGRVLAAAALHGLPAGITGMSSRAYGQLPSLVSAGVQKLVADQYPEGGWPWFNDPMEPSDPVITADAVQALAASGHEGSAVQQAIQRGRQYLLNALSQTPALSTEEQAHVLLVLAASGGGQRAGAESLYGNSVRRLHLAPGPLADLGMALALAHDARRAGSPASRFQAVAAVLDGDAVVSATGAHWETGGMDYWAGGAIQATTQVLAALLALRPHDPFVPAAVRWLMFARAGGVCNTPILTASPGSCGWDSSHDTAQAIATLAAYARAAREGHADYSYRVMMNGATKAAGRYGSNDQRKVTILQVPVTELNRAHATMLEIGRAAPNGTYGPGPLYYLARLHYYLDARNIAPRSEGITVSRRYLDLHGRQITSAPVGGAFKVQLTVHTDATLFYLDLEDPIPAGCEPIDESLNTSQQGLVKPQTWWWPFSGSVHDLSFFLSHSDLRDDRVSLYAYFLPPGTYHYTYLATATVPGRYSVAPTHVSEAFFPDVFGRGAGVDFVVK